MFPAMVCKSGDSVSLRWSEDESFAARAFYKHYVPTGRGNLGWNNLAKKTEKSRAGENVGLPDLVME
jgi:hypothetical protein